MRILALLLCLWLVASPASPVSARDAMQSRNMVVDELPAEAKQTLRLIRQGGPFPHKQDGVVFGNRENLLPRRPRGYYREYTVTTPGSRDRGARRIVAGSGDGGDVRTSNDYWYSDDHYNSFRRIN